MIGFDWGNAMPGRNIPEDDGRESGEQSKNNEPNKNGGEMLRGNGKSRGNKHNDKRKLGKYTRSDKQRILKRRRKRDYQCEERKKKTGEEAGKEQRRTIKGRNGYIIAHPAR